MLLLAIGIAVAPPPQAEDAAVAPRALLLLDEAYPVEVVYSFHAALLHWMDSLARLEGPGMTAGKTVGAHRRDFVEHHATTDETDLAVLRDYGDVRRRHGRLLTDLFFEAPSLASAFGEASVLLPEADVDKLRTAFDHYGARYEPVWQDGRVPRRFVERCARDPQRQALSRFLVEVAAFFRVSPTDAPRPRLILAPVRDGYGTHAQALGRHLLLEIRPWDGLTDEVGPIVHENVHFLFLRIPEERRRALEKVARQQGRRGVRAWSTLREALPTAIAQGVAARRFMGKRWSRRNGWYHHEEVDRYAKKIYPTVRRALENGEPFDEKLLLELIERFPG